MSEKDQFEHDEERAARLRAAGTRRAEAARRGELDDQGQARRSGTFGWVEAATMAVPVAAATSGIVREKLRQAGRTERTRIIQQNETERERIRHQHQNEPPTD